MNLLDDLNSQQREAVLATEGPVLVLAGAGTGKTRVDHLSHRLSDPARRAAGRIFLASHSQTKRPTRCGTACGLCLCALGSTPASQCSRRFIPSARACFAARLRGSGLRRDFAIYDDDDQSAALRIAAERLGMPSADRRCAPSRTTSVTQRITRSRPEESASDAERTSNDRARQSAESMRPMKTCCTRRARSISTICCLRAAQVLREHEEARRSWQSRFRYLMVDEFQDTNRPQYELLKLLTGPERNLCVVGDEDQSIYSWRGAFVGTPAALRRGFSRREADPARTKLSLAPTDSRCRRRRREP